MELKVVPGKGRAIFSTVDSKPGFVPIHQHVSIPDVNPRIKALHCSVTDPVCWCYLPRAYRDIVLTAVRSL